MLYLYIRLCVCVCVCVTVNWRLRYKEMKEREGKRLGQYEKTRISGAVLESVVASKRQ